jgi:ABC-2 type transport system permease protein
MLLIALYGSRTEAAGFSLQAAITFTGLSQATIGPLSMFNWYELMRTVYSGDIGSDLLKPMNYFTYWLAKDFGRFCASFLWRGITIMLVYMLVFDITYPQTPMQWVYLFVSLILAWLVSFSWRFLVNLSAFWSPNALGVGRFFFIISWFLSGFLMPLRFYPQWVIQLAHLTPFAHTVNTIVEIYLGVLTGDEILFALFNQVIWAVVLMVVSGIVMRAGVRRLVIQGG